eukprot:g1085.t1
MVFGQRRTCTQGTLSLFQSLSRGRDLSIFTSAIRVAEAIPQFSDPAIAITVFVPIDYSFGNILPVGRGFFDLVPDIAIAQALVNYHSVDGPIPARALNEGRRMNTALAKNGRQLRLEIVEDITSPTGLKVMGALNSANITQTDIIGCNSVVHIIDAVLLPDADILPIGSTTIGEAIETAESFDMLLTPMREGDEERRAESRSRLMLTEVAITMEEILEASPEAEDETTAILIATENELTTNTSSLSRG